MTSIPLRKCIGCGVKKTKQEFLMVLKSPKSQSSVDFKVLQGGNKSAGRSAYVCFSSECLMKAKKARRLERTFKTKIESTIYDTIEKEISNHE